MRVDPDSQTFVVDEHHRYPLERVEFEDRDVDGRIWHRRCGLMRFESGATISIIYGEATYCVNRDTWFTGEPLDEDPITVEAWPSWEPEPRGYVDRDELLLLIAEANIQPSAERH